MQLLKRVRNLFKIWISQIPGIHMIQLVNFDITEEVFFATLTSEYIELQTQRNTITT